MAVCAAIFAAKQQTMAKIENITELQGFIRGLGKFTVKRGRKTLYGLINTDGEIVLEPQPREIGIYDEKTVLLSDKGKVWSGMTVLDLEDKTECSREHFYAKKNGLVITYQRGKGQGAIDIDGNVVIPHKYRDLCCDDSFNLYFARNRKNKCGILNSRGEEVLPFEYDDIAFARNNDRVVSDRICVRQGADWFIVDRSGRRLSANRYDELERFTPNGYAIFGEKIHEEMYYGVIDTNENIVIPAKYSGSLHAIYGIRWLDRYADGWTKLAVPKEGIGGEEVLTLAGEAALPRAYGHIWGCYRENYIVKQCAGDSYSDNLFYGVVNEVGQTIISFEFDYIFLMAKTFYLVSHYGQQGLYSLDGRVVLPCEYDRISVGTDIDRIAVCKKGDWYDEWSYVNRRGERVLL